MPRSVNNMKIPMRKARSRILSEKSKLLGDESRVKKPRKLPKIDNFVPEAIFDTEKKGTNAKFFDKSKLDPISNFRTKDGKNFDEEVELRRKRFVRNQNDELNDEL